MASAANPSRARSGPAAAPVPLADRPALEVRHRGLLTVAIMMATVMQILDTTIANVALPHMQTSLGATADSVTWVLTSYILATAVAIPVTGWLADRVGGRNLFLFAIISFTISSALCGLATSLTEMVLFRFIQGISAAFINPLSQAFMLDINRPSQHGRAISIWGMGIMIGPILGPVLGGYLTENYDWRWVFFINIPIGIVTTLMFLALLPRKASTGRRFDLFGFSMIAIGLASLQLLLDRGHQEDWFDSWEICIEAGVAIAAFWVYLVHQFTSRRPLFDRELITDRNLITALAFMTVVGVVMFASMALLPPMMQILYGYPVLDAGLLMAPRGVGVLISMGIAGQLQGRMDMRGPMMIGASIAAYSLYMMAGWSLDTGWQEMAFVGFIQGLGMGMVFIPINLLAFATLDSKYRTDGASLLNLFRNIGASISIAALTSLLARNTQVSHSDLVGHITDSSLSAIDPTMAERLGPYGDAAMMAVNGEVTRQAAMIAYVDDYWVMMWITIFAIPLLALMRPPKKGAAPPPPMGE